MNKFDFLINKFCCTNDVEFRPLNEVVSINSGEQITKNELIPNGTYIAISGGMKPFGRINKYNCDENTITIARYGSAGFVSFQTEKFWSNDVCYTLSKNENVIKNKFLYYFLKSNQNYIYSLTQNAIPNNLKKEKLGKILIPIPPMDVQTKIVSILDKFNTLLNESEKGIPKEIELRRKQYNYYLNQLMSFKKEKKD